MTEALVNEDKAADVEHKVNHIKPISNENIQTVLIVEDSPTELMRTALLIEKFGYHAVTAKDGVDALKILGTKPIDLIVSDWHMPNMDGITLCKTLGEIVDFPPYFLILTGRTNRCELIAAMDAGADDYLSKPIKSEELRVRIQAGLRLRQLSESLAQKNAALKIALSREKGLNQTVQESLRVAAKLQRSTLPDKCEVVNKVAIAHCFRPAQGVAGDSYALLKLDSEHVAFFQIDVTGIGISAAMRSYAIVKSLQERARQYTINSKTSNMLCPISVTRTLNEEFACDADSDNCFTLIYGVLHINSQHGRMVLAGHPPPYLVSPSGEITKLGDTGEPLGIQGKADFNEVTFTLNKGCKLVLYSDGIFECTTPNGIAFNETMLLQLLSNIRSTSIVRLQQQIETVIDRLIGANPLLDDLSLLVLEELDKSELLPPLSQE